MLVFPPLDDDDKYSVMPFFQLPKETLELSVRNDLVNYDLWQRHRFIKTTESNVAHYGFIESFIEKLSKKYNIREIVFDRWRAV